MKQTTRHIFTCPQRRDDALKAQSELQAIFERIQNI